MTDEKNAPSGRMREALWRRRSRLQRWAMVLTALFGLYLLLGFLLVPVILKQQLIAQTHKATGRDLAVAAVAFNPLRLALQIDGLSLKEADGEPFAGWDSLRVDFEASSLWRRAWTFAEIRLVWPRVQVHRLNADTFNFTGLLPPSAPPSSGPPPAAAQASAPAALPAILIERLEISGGELVYRDDTHADAPVLKYLPIDFRMSAFSTRADPAAPTRGELAVLGAGGERFHWQGDLRLPALASSGRIEATGFDLAALSRFAAEALPFHLAHGKLDFQAGYRLTAEPAGSPRVQVSDGALTFSDLALADKAAPEAAPIGIARIAVTGVGADTAARTVAIAQVAASGGRIAATLAADGQLDLLRLFAAPAAAQAPAAPAAPAAARWLATLARLSVDGFRVQVTDAGSTPPVTLALDPLRVTLENFRSDNREPLQIAFDSGVNDGGTLRINGPVALAPLHAELAIDAQQIPLAGLQPYLGRVINIQLHSGTLHTTGTLTWPEAGQSAGLRYQGDAGIDDLKTTDNRFNREFLSWKKLAIKNLEFEQTANRIAIDSIDFTGLYGRLAIREDGTTNVAKLLVSAPSAGVPPTSSAPAPAVPAPGPAPAAAPARPFAVRIGRVALADSAAYFADLTLTPDFRVGIFNLRGAVTDIDSGAGRPIAVKLDGQVDRYAPVTIAGQVNPFLASPALDLKLAFKNLDMTTFTPYSGVYAGHRIKQGQLSVDLQYQLDNDQLVGHNHIVMNQMELGERVASPKAVDLPLRLALALLKDSKGVIDLGLEVKGNVREPSFSVGGLVWKAFRNLIVKAVSAPFNLIAGLVGGSEGGALDTVGFAPGSEQLDTPETVKLDKLAKGLAERPQLRLAVTGNVQPEEDSRALAQHRLEQRLAELMDSGGAEGERPWPGLSAAVADKGFRKKLYALYESTTKERVADRKAIIAKALGDGGGQPTDAEVDAALHQHIEHELLAREEVSDKALSALADQRALAVKAYLVDRGGVAPERVFMVADRKGAAPARSARLALDAL